MSIYKKINVAVIGATGYTGLDLIYMLSKHTNIKILNLCATKNLGKEINFEECMMMEFRMVNKVMNDHDFYEGVRALIIDKDNNPNWMDSKKLKQEYLDLVKDTMTNMTPAEKREVIKKVAEIVSIA